MPRFTTLLWLLPGFAVLLLAATWTWHLPTELSATGIGGLEKIVHRCQTGSDGLCIMNPDGTGMESIPESVLTDRNPEISPDGQLIAFDRGLGNIFVMDSDLTNARELFANEGDFEYPAWSQDGSQLAMRCELPGPPATTGVCTVDADGSNLEMIAEFDDPTFLDWSPDGESILVHHVEVTVNEDMYVLDVSSGNSTNITNTESDEEYGSWSPDGTQIAFVGGPFAGEVDVGRNLYIINADGTGRQLLYNPAIGAFASPPAWSPDGEVIAFVCDTVAGNASEMCFIDADSGSLLRNPMAGTNEFWATPDWSYLVEETVIWGDWDCSGELDGLDALLAAQFAAGLGTNTGACPPLDSTVVQLPAGLGWSWGDIDCSGGINPIDTIRGLLAAIGEAIDQQGDCPEPGEEFGFILPPS